MKKYYWLVILAAVVFCSITAINVATAGPLVDVAKKTEQLASEAADKAKDYYGKAPSFDQVRRDASDMVKDAKGKVHEWTK